MVQVSRASFQRGAFTGLLVVASAAAVACSGESNPPRSAGSSGTGTTSGGDSNAGGSGGSIATTGGNTTTSNGGTTSGTTGGTTSSLGGASTTTGGATATTGGTGSGTTGGAATSGAGGGGGATCQMANYTFMPKIPTVYVMVDRSGSMFDCQSTTNRENSCETQSDTSWVKLRDAALAVIRGLQADVRFGFTSFMGTDPAHGGTCPQLDQVDAALNNADKIATVYNALAFQPNTQESGKKFETPAGQALTTVGNKLIADTYPGDKYILFVTDGQPDYCDDSNTLCAPDSVVFSLQALKAKGITTIVMGLQPTSGSDLAPGILQSFANAGVGEPTLAPLRAGLDSFALYDQCNFIAGWAADLTASGKPKERGATLGNYSATAGPTKPYTPAANDQAALTTQLGAALAGVKSCTFDLSNVNGQSIKVDLNKLAEASIAIEGKMVAQDPATGWSMGSPTQLVLNGAACDTWRMPDVNDISFNFPCKTIIFE